MQLWDETVEAVDEQWEPIWAREDVQAQAAMGVVFAFALVALCLVVDRLWLLLCAWAGRW